MKPLLLRLVLTMAIAFVHPASMADETPGTSPAAPAKSIPFKKEDASAGETAGRTFAILAVLLGLACAGLVVVRRRFPQLNISSAFPLVGGAKRRLNLVETMRLGPRASLYLVKLDGRELLLAQSGDAITHIIHDRLANGASVQESENHV